MQEKTHGIHSPNMFEEHQVRKSPNGELHTKGIVLIASGKSVEYSYWRKDT